MRLREIMTRDVQTIGVEATISDAARAMREANVSCLVVMKSEQVSGVISERDLVLGCLIDGHFSWECQVFRHVNIQSSVAHPDMIITDAVVMMIENEIDTLPVVENSEVVGLVSPAAFSRAIALEMSEGLGETS